MKSRHYKMRPNSAGYWVVDGPAVQGILMVNHQDALACVDACELAFRAGRAQRQG